MNLFFGGSLGSLMKPYFFKKLGPRTIIRNMLRSNILCNSNKTNVNLIF